jgi:hypothetical protein
MLQAQHSDISHMTLPNLSLPSELIEQALLPLPESAPLFQKALTSSDELDESDLWRWKDGPPYVIEAGSSSTEPGGSSSTAAEMNFTARLAEVMMGVWLREQNRDDEVRRQLLQSNYAEALRSLHGDVIIALEEWEVMKVFLEYYTADS